MIFLTGCARSGTSLTTSILQAHGLNLGKINGLFENTDIRQKVVKPYLASIGADPLGQNPLPAIESVKPVPGFREQVIENFDTKPPVEPWGYKCAKLVLFWPVWREAFPDATYIVIRRNRERIIDSCMRTPFMWKRDTREEWGAWVDEHTRRFDQMMNAFDNIYEFWPNANDPACFRGVVERCGFDFDITKAERLCDPEKWH